MNQSASPPEQRITEIFDDLSLMNQVIQRERIRSFDDDLMTIPITKEIVIEAISFQRFYHLYLNQRIFVRVARHQIVLVIGSHNFWRLSQISKDWKKIPLNETPAVLLKLFPLFDFDKDCTDKFAFLARNSKFHSWELVTCRSVFFSSDRISTQIEDICMYFIQ